MKAILALNREVRHVPLDFDTPLGETWSGYLMPDELHLPPCPTCGPASSSSYGDNGDGYTPEARAIEKTFYCLDLPDGSVRDALKWCDKLGQKEVDNLVAEGRLQKLVRCEPNDTEVSEYERRRGSKWVTVPRNAAEINAQNQTLGLNSHDGINRWILVQFRCEQLGIEIHCPACEGTGMGGTPEQRASYEEWEAPEPPSGPGIQMWQTVSEGGPISPVFENTVSGRLEMARWLSANESLPGRSISVDDWLKIIKGSVLGQDIQSGQLT